MRRSHRRRPPWCSRCAFRRGTPSPRARRSGRGDARRSPAAPHRCDADRGRRRRAPRVHAAGGLSPRGTRRCRRSRCSTAAAAAPRCAWWTAGDWSPGCRPFQGDRTRPPCATVPHPPRPSRSQGAEGSARGGTKFRPGAGSRLKPPVPHPPCRTHRTRFLSGSNIDFIEGLYARWLEDPASVDPSWRELFASTAPPRAGPSRSASNGNGHGGRSPAAPARPTATAGAAVQAPGPGAGAALPRGAMQLQARVDQTLYAFRLRGHLLAQIDPLGRPRAADRATWPTWRWSATRHFTAEELEQVVDSSDVVPDESRVKLRELLERLRRTYCGHIGVEYMTLYDSERRRWLMPRHGAHREPARAPRWRSSGASSTKLTDAEIFEDFIHTKYLGAKRFSSTAARASSRCSTPCSSWAASSGVRGGRHRHGPPRPAQRARQHPGQDARTRSSASSTGRSTREQYLGRGDVKYHLGFSSDCTTATGQEDPPRRSPSTRATSSS